MQVHHTGRRVRPQDAESGNQACVDRGQGAHRTLPPEQVAQWAAKLEELNDGVAAILKEEKEEKAIRQAQMELPHLYRQQDMATRRCSNSVCVRRPRIAAASTTPILYRCRLRHHLLCPQSFLSFPVSPFVSPQSHTLQQQ